jgi:hypothetical protein
MVNTLGLSVRQQNDTFKIEKVFVREYVDEGQSQFCGSIKTTFSGLTTGSELPLLAKSRTTNLSI